MNEQHLSTVHQDPGRFQGLRIFGILAGTLVDTQLTAFVRIYREAFMK